MQHFSSLLDYPFVEPLLQKKISYSALVHKSLGEQIVSVIFELHSLLSDWTGGLVQRLGTPGSIQKVVRFNSSQSA